MGVNTDDAGLLERKYGASPDCPPRRTAVMLVRRTSIAPLVLTAGIHVPGRVS